MDKKLLDFIKNKNNNNLTNDENERLKKLNKYRLELERLKTQPYIKQRSPEWFELRKNRLTASDLADAIAKNNSSLVKKKAGLFHDASNIDFSKIKPLVWGTMFEPMAIRTYSQRNNDIKINEFGLIPHESLNHFGASPDGITELGIMIEIKCPYSRQIIDDKIPDKYYMQIQGQLAVCNLEECDYIECEFKLYENKEDYLSETQESNVDHGIIAEFKEQVYEYSDPYLTKEEAIRDIKTKIENKNNFIQFKYWKLVKINVQKVYFNKQEWESAIVPKINDFWNKVISYRKTGPFIDEDTD
jgi:putative phage-type endonuclease